VPYFIINRQPVFLPSERYRELEGIISEDKGPEWRIASVMAGSEESEEKSELMYDTLSRVFSEDPQHFNSHWMEFDLLGNEAAANTWDLLYDYCHYYGHAFLSDLRDIPEKLTADFLGDSYSYPMGKVFALNHVVKPNRWWWRISRGMKGRVIRAIVDVDKVARLKGNLRRFVLYSDNYKMICGKNLDIYLG
jgi:hypothetical protein